MNFLPPDQFVKVSEAPIALTREFLCHTDWLQECRVTERLMPKGWITIYPVARTFWCNIRGLWA